MTNQTVFITGASSGIGRALAKEFANQKADLILTARRLDRLQSLVADIQTSGGSAIPIQCDVTRDGDLDRAVKVALETYGKLDIVIANAGFGVAGDFEVFSVEDYRRQFETNVFGVLRTIYATLDSLKKSKGTLVLIGSVCGYVSLPGGSPYAMSKFAIHALAQSLTHELRPYGVSVVLIAPGFIESEFRQVDNQGNFHPLVEDPISSRLRMPTEKAAKQMVRAILQKKSEEIITHHGKWIIFIKRHFPWVLDICIKMGLRARPEPK